MKRVLVLGDLMLDCRRYGFSCRTSPEAPKCKILSKTETVYELGGAANVAHWLSFAPDVQVTMMGLVGADSWKTILELLALKAGIRPLTLIKGNQTTVKERIVLVDESKTTVEHLVRLDQDSEEVLGFMEAQLILNHMKEEVWDLVVVADYGKGVFGGDYGKSLLTSTAFQMPTAPIIVNAKHAYNWKNVPVKYLICNDQEASLNFHECSDNRICELIQAEWFIRTLGPKGVRAVSKRGDCLKCPSLAKTVVDVTGAGDALTAGLAAGYLNSCQINDGLTLGLQWAADCVAQVGCGKPKEAKTQWEALTAGR